MFAAIHVRADKPGGQSSVLLRLAQEFSPLVEQTDADTVALDADGLERIYGLPQQIAAALARRAVERGLEASVAIAANLDTAVHAARGFSGVNVIPYGDEAKYLGSLPLTALGATPEMLETLERWGIRRCRDLAALPELGLAERLGEEGLRLHKMARGTSDRPLVPVQEPLHFAEETELEYPVDLLEPLMFVLSRLLHDLRARLATHGLATNELRLRLTLENRGEHARTLRFPVPMLDIQAFLKLLDLDLGAHPPPAPVVKVWLEAEPAKPRAAQTGLFIPLTPEPEKLELTLARLRSLVGGQNVGSPALLDTHRPGAFRMLPRPPLSASLHNSACASVPLRAMRPPRMARVQMASGQPVHVQAEGVRGHVVSSAGPWRTSGDWWTADPWARDEWDVALSDGALYRIYSEQGRWFVDGSYD
ncbi:MAG TPA: DNA polymerase Y family protein [Bryobacteraceae bacterium]|nr:DNA polymerase Y family protein [Bryobacteraceae bacterium]